MSILMILRVRVWYTGKAFENRVFFVIIFYQSKWLAVVRRKYVIVRDNQTICYFRMRYDKLLKVYECTCCFDTYV